MMETLNSPAIIKLVIRYTQIYIPVNKNSGYPGKVILKWLVIISQCHNVEGNQENQNSRIFYLNNPTFYVLLMNFRCRIFFSGVYHPQGTQDENWCSNKKYENFDFIRLCLQGEIDAKSDRLKDWQEIPILTV